MEGNYQWAATVGLFLDLDVFEMWLQIRWIWSAGPCPSQVWAGENLRRKALITRPFRVNIPIEFRSMADRATYAPGFAVCRSDILSNAWQISRT
jgi:hypothetical protein